MAKKGLARFNVIATNQLNLILQTQTLSLNYYRDIRLQFLTLDRSDCLSLF